jgi:hypothetical protein
VGRLVLLPHGDGELRVVLEGDLSAGLGALDVREVELVEAPDALVGVDVPDRIEQRILDGLLVVPRRVRRQLGVELEVEQRRLGRGAKARRDACCAIPSNECSGVRSPPTARHH